MKFGYESVDALLRAFNGDRIADSNRVPSVVRIAVNANDAHPRSPKPVRDHLANLTRCLLLCCHDAY